MLSGQGFPSVRVNSPEAMLVCWSWRLRADAPVMHSEIKGGNYVVLSP